MVRYFVDPITESIMGSQFRRKTIRQHAEINRLRFAKQFSELACIRVDPTAAVPRNSFLECAVAIEKVVIFERRRLIEDRIRRN